MDLEFQSELSDLSKEICGKASHFVPSSFLLVKQRFVPHTNQFTINYLQHLRQKPLFLGSRRAIKRCKDFLNVVKTFLKRCKDFLLTGP